jgi:proteic killer suppression protein
MLEIVFRNTLLSDLFEGKKVDDKEFRSNPTLVKQYIKTVNKLRSATKIEQLFQMTSLSYEKLRGNRAGQSSVRINDQYRLIFEEIKKEDVVKILALEEISKHYE